MVRGITAATVVPTASDDRIEPSVSDEEEGVEYSSEEENSSIPGSTVAELESEKYLHAAFNGHVNDPTPTAPSNKAITTGVQVNLQQSNPKSLQQKSVAPLVGKTLRQRSQSAVMQKQNGVELTKNYLELVRDFQQLQPFTRRPDGKYPTDTRCVYCVDAKPTSVFFPCQHMCVCNDCIQLNNISTDYSSTTDWW
ncbi:hypothetical protein P3T76_011995 [Phytophthora citrophthora]|uniref:Uncharacterized protein n=1 Tax=Phytophthora citrophthora TaxID=4793 RepID=A0AAD9G5V9_9STRA|nr:hypothetical protein P3T76_011995 [Phytophthora citrophthora]